MDMNTGDIYLDENNNVVEVDNKRAFEQILDGLFHCDPGSEVMNPYYGFDLRSVLRDTGIEASEMLVESIVSQALDPKIEKLISEVNTIKVEKDGTTMNVTIGVTSILADTVEMSVGV
jgi:phage baseplate assembly protein W